MIESDTLTSTTNVGEMYLFSSLVLPPTTTLPLLRSSIDFTRLPVHTTTEVVVVANALEYVQTESHLAVVAHTLLRRY